MARPLRTDKQTVDLRAAGPKVSRIRRDPPPPPPRKISPSELRSREARIILVGLIASGLILVILLVQIGRWAGWSPADYTIVFDGRR